MRSHPIFQPMLAAFAAAAVFFSLLPFSAFAAAPGSISGRVLDSNSVPLAGATVTISSTGRTAITDSAGNYSLRKVSEGTQTLSATKIGYVAASVQVTVKSRQNAVAPDLRLAQEAPTYGNIAGRVTASDTGAAIAGASVVVSGTNFQMTTDSGGNYSFMNVPSGSETVAASANGYQTAAKTVTVTGGSTVTADLSMTPTPAVPAPGSTISWHGSSKYLLGADFPWWNYATDFGTGGWGKYTDWNQIDASFSAMQSRGVHLTRWWVFGDGRYAPEFDADGMVTGLDPNFLGDIDHALQIAATHHIFITFSLVDNIMWAPATYSGSVAMGGHAALVTDPAVQQSFLDNALKPLLTHIAASPNKDMVLGYDIVSEPEAQMKGYWGGVGLDPAAVKAFVQNSASYIHAYGGGSYATLDSAQPAYVATWKGLGLDFYELHYYPWMDFGGAPGSGLPAYYSLNLDKPAVISEFQTVDSSYAFDDTTPLSAQWYLDTIYKYGYAGAMAWSFGAGDSVSNWAAFQPVFSRWETAHNVYTGPQ